MGVNFHLCAAPRQLPEIASKEAASKRREPQQKKMAEVSPITRQITKENHDFGAATVDFRLEEVEDCLVYDRHGVGVPFKKLYQDRKSIIIFVRVKFALGFNRTLFCLY